jgi:polyferredoxin
MTLFYRLAADTVVLVHMTYVLTVVLGLPAIWIGILCRHKWARNFWWRCGHLSMIAIVVAEAWAGITCPLTTWEYQLRELAEQETYSGSFIANLVHDYLFYKAPKWVFTMAYSLFGLLVLISFLVAPPHWPRPRKPVTTT